MILFFITVMAVLFGMALILYRALEGPTIFDRILAANAFGTKTVLLILILAFLVGDMNYIDVALVYALINFITVIALLRYFKYGSFNGKETS